MEMSLPKFPDRKPTWVIPYDDRIKELEQQLAEAKRDADEFEQVAANHINANEELRQQLAEREGFYEKLWKDFISLQRGDFQLIALEAEECRRVKEQLAEREKQIVMLRNALQVAWDFEPECGPPCCDERISEALAATQDLSGLVLCDAKPVGEVDQDDDVKWGDIYTDTDVRVGTKLYKARKQP
jgi:hypothetical protein